MKFRKFLKNNIVVLDGSMGAVLQGCGLKPGELPERWNVEHRDVIIGLQKSYFDAGANVVYTNTFGANGLKYDDKELGVLVRAAIVNAKVARELSIGTQEKFISLSIGPSGRMLKPYGDLDFEEAVELFSKVVKIAEKEGVDLYTVETMNDSYETKAAVLAIKENSDKPIIVTNAYRQDEKLMTGASPEAMVAMLEGMGVDAVGANCSLGPKELKNVVKRMLKVASIPVVMKPNAGIPAFVDGKTIYTVDEEEFSEVLLEMINEGVGVVGGCCGTTPKYIQNLAKKAKELKPKKITDKNLTVISSYTHAVEFGKEPILIGERINPTGKKRMKEALINNDVTYILTEGLKQQDKGVHVLDVNVGIPEVDEPTVMKNMVEELQAVINLPLQIDTSNYEAMEKALRIYNGKPLINSVSGKMESMERIFPLAKKYGGAIICLTLDENGIPETKEGRVEIAKKIIEKAKEYGIQKKDLIFDTLTLTVSADKTAPDVTLKALKSIKKDLKCETSLGVSNVSFGLPNRDAINSTFFALALKNGLSAAIMNPYSDAMMNTYYSYKALNGMDDNFQEYIEGMEKLSRNAEIDKAIKKETAKTENAKEEIIKAEEIASGENLNKDAKQEKTGSLSELSYAITKGLKDEAKRITKELLNSSSPMDIINKEIIPALDIVGKGFEEKRVFLPNLLISAEAAQAAFEKIKEHGLSIIDDITGNDKPKKKKIVIATVHGDIHDIGKNIVKLLLENYGYEVIDLGKDVPEDVVVSKATEEKADYVGLSALMTTTLPAMERTIQYLKEKAPNIRIVVGGAVLSKEYAEKIGADRYAKDAMDTVRFLAE